MKYTNHYKSIRVFALAFMALWFILFVCACIIFLITFLQEPSVDYWPCFVMLIFMGFGSSVVAYIWFHTIISIELENQVVTFTYLTNKQVTVPVNDIIKVKEYSNTYVFKTDRKTYSMAVKFNYASMKDETIDFIQPKYFPHAVFEQGCY